MSKIEPPKTPLTPDEQIIQKLDEISMHLKHMDQRDKLRMTGGIFRSLLGIIPLVVTLWGAWYLYAHFDDLMRTVMRQAAEQTVEATKNGSNSMLDEMKKLLK